jgi:hypothetical protein
MPKVTMEFDLDTLARELADWSYEDLMELIKVIDETKSEWEFISLLKPWVDGEYRKMVQEETRDKADREGRCQRDPQNLGIWVHVDPHVGCVLR